jgi:signal transduction histidine kinase
MKQMELPSMHAAAPAWVHASVRRAVSILQWPRSRLRSRLFVKYVALFVAVVCVALLANESFQIWFFYKEHMASLIQIQRQQAEAAAVKIEQFIREIESQLGWTTQLPWVASTLEQRRVDTLRLLNQVPAITELRQIDPSGRERLRVSRLETDVIDSRKDFSRDPRFTEAVANKRYYGPVYFRKESEPYMTLALAGSRRDAGVSIAEVNLKFIWDLISQIKVGKEGRAMVVDGIGRLIAHPDVSLVLRKIDLSQLDQVKVAHGDNLEASTGIVENARDLKGQQVLSAYARIAPLNWLVFVGLPSKEAYAPLNATIWQMAFVLFGALGLAGLAGMVLARKMVVPIQALGTGAARIGSGDLEQNITIKTGDELEALANQFNDMAGKLRESYAEMESKVEIRTRELAQSVNELRALGEVSQAVNSTLDLESVLTTIVIKAVQLSGTDAGAIYVFDEVKQTFSLRATCGMSEVMIAALMHEVIDLNDANIASAIRKHEPTQIREIREEPPTPIREIALQGGFHSFLIEPLMGLDHALGVLVVHRREPGFFEKAVLDLLKTFGAQSALAIQNARLYHELEEKSRQLEVISRHKSQFLANMSHELRTPLNAILGYTELILKNMYGEPPERMRAVVSRVNYNGVHLLNLINDVLDISKIEAGQLTLSLANYSMKHVVHNVCAVVEPLATAKELAFKVEIAPDLPPGRGDDRRLTQALLNLVGNAIKFTDAGEVSIRVLVANGAFEISVRDTGPGIDPADQAKIFEAFRQVNRSGTRKKSGTGLGLSIASHVIEMHGGRIWVDSSPGCGATFFFSIPVDAGQPARST